MTVIDMQTRRPLSSGRRFSVVKCDAGEKLVVEPTPTREEASRYATRNLEDAIDCFRGVFGPRVCAEVLEHQARHERTLSPNRTLEAGS
jgi:hypothetical protein